MQRLLAALVILLGAAVPARGTGVLPVVTTSTDLKSLVQAVGGRLATVESLAPPSQDPHAVDVRPGQLTSLRSAVLLVSVGLDHEPWLPRLLKTLNDPRLAPGRPGYLDLSRTVELLQTDVPRLAGASPHVHGFGNPHYWLDPENARPMTAAILDALARLAPGARPELEANRARFLADLDAGLARWHQAMARYRKTRVVVMHDTWPYFARRFGLVVVAAAEPSPGVPPSPASLARLITRMRETGVDLILAESSSPANLAAQLAGRTGARVATLVASVGADPDARDYLTLFEVNIRRLITVLGDKAPR